MSERLYEILRHEKTTSQLKEIAKTLGIDVSDVPDNRHKKETIVQRILKVVAGGGWIVNALSRQKEKK